MLKALLYKELRETGWITLLALAAYFVAAASCAGYPLLPIFGRGWEVGEIPFLDGSFITAFCWISVAYTIALGFRQTAFESARGTWVFLLHRPASIRYLFAVKLAVGAASYGFWLNTRHPSARARR